MFSHQGHIIRIYHECEGRIEKSVPRISVWNHEACRVMTNGDFEGRMDSFSCSPLFIFIYLFIYLFICFKISFQKSPNSEYAKKQFHMMTLLDVLGRRAFSIPG